MNQLTTQHVYISGRVQGVGYRYSLTHQAQALGILGWCRNLPDGRVEAMFQGNQEQLSAIIAWCQQGPSQAQVDNVEIFEIADPPQYPNFEIRG